MKLSDELRAKLEELKAQAKELNIKNGVTLDEINAKADEIKVVKAKLKVQEELEADEEAEAAANINNGGGTIIDMGGNPQNKLMSIYNKKMQGMEVSANEELQFRGIFNKVLRNSTLSDAENEVYKDFKNAYSSGSDSTGGALIPLDQNVLINEFKRAIFDITPYIDIEFTNTLKGTRVYETLADLAELENLDENKDINEDAAESFTVVTYVVHDYAGKIKIPNSLLEDQQADLVGYIYRKLAKRVLYHTFRKVFFGKGAAKKDCEGLITNFDSSKKTVVLDAAITIAKLKSIVEVDLDPAISEISALYMNQDAWNLVSGLDEANKNKNTQYIIYDIKEPIKKRFLGRDIIVLPNKWMPTDATDKKAYIVIGNLYEAIVAYIRKTIQIESTRVGGEAWSKNLTEYRYILRMDTQLKDLEAVKIIKTPLA